MKRRNSEVRYAFPIAYAYPFEPLPVAETFPTHCTAKCLMPKNVCTFVFPHFLNSALEDSLQAAASL